MTKDDERTKMGYGGPSPATELDTARLFYGRARQKRVGFPSAKPSADQFNLPLEDAELAQDMLEAAHVNAEAAVQRARGEEPRKPNRMRRHLPAQLPRVERLAETPSTLLLCH